MTAHRADRDDETVGAVLTASRAMLGVVARSLAGTLETITLPQFRVLVLLSSQGAQRTSTLAERLAINLSTFSRSLDKMVTSGWVRREQNPDSRREVIISLTPEGRGVVDAVTEQRRTELSEILGRLSPSAREQVLNALELFNAAAGEPRVDDLLVLGL
jgi:DNA-binding MarR family transcriptional regulator